MPDQKQFNISWLQALEIPPEGAECPKCNEGFLKKSQYWEGVYCPSCNWKFRLSKFPPKEKKQIKTETPLKEQDQGEQILKGLREIYIKLNALEVKLVALNETLKRFESEDKVIFYPKNQDNTGILKQSEPDL